MSSSSSSSSSSFLASSFAAAGASAAAAPPPPPPPPAEAKTGPPMTTFPQTNRLVQHSKALCKHEKKIPHESIEKAILTSIITALQEENSVAMKFCWRHSAAQDVTNSRKGVEFCRIQLHVT